MTLPSFQERNARQFPSNYRIEIVSEIMNLIASGESCFVIGMSGTGKSNLFRCISQKGTHQRYLTDPKKTFAFVWVDINNLASEEMSDFAVYELLIYNLQKWVEDNNASEDVVELVRQLHEKVMLSKDRMVAQRHLETAIRYLFNHIEDIHIVFLFDEFESVLRNLNFQFFRNLRWLRDEFKYHISYVMASHRSPTSVRAEFFDQGEALHELFASNILGLRPYNNEDSQFTLQELSNRYDIKLDQRKRNIIINFSGGHGGLIVALFKVLIKLSPPHTNPALVKQLMNYDAVAGECRKIWNSLEVQEQDTLINLVKNGFRSDKGLPLGGLISKGIIKKNSEGYTIFSALFQEFLTDTVNRYQLETSS